jgi:hypothetical protein
VGGPLKSTCTIGGTKVSHVFGAETLEYLVFGPNKSWVLKTSPKRQVGTSRVQVPPIVPLGQVPSSGPPLEDQVGMSGKSTRCHLGLEWEKLVAPVQPAQEHHSSAHTILSEL